MIAVIFTTKKYHSQYTESPVSASSKILLIITNAIIEKINADVSTLLQNTIYHTTSQNVAQ